MAHTINAPAVKLKDAVKNYGKIQALKGINLTVAPGEVVAFLGPNGAGKSTSIALMLGLRPPTSGSVTVYGGDPRDPRHRRRIGAMLQESGVPSTLKVRELVELFGRFHDDPMATHSAIKMAQLEGKENARLGTLSGGQKQRVYFALALVGNPDILFLDEPTTGLDVESRHNFWDQIGTQVEHGKTIILTTHNLEEADALARRIVVINQGTIIAEGTPDDIKRHVGGKHVRFRAPQMTLAELQMLPGVLEVGQHDEKFTIYTREAEEVLGMLFRNGTKLSDLEVTGVGLEEAFLALTQTTNGAH